MHLRVILQKRCSGRRQRRQQLGFLFCADTSCKNRDATTQMLKPFNPIRPSSRVALRRPHTTEEHVHEHASAAHRIADLQSALLFALRKPIGKLLPCGKQALFVKDVDELRKLARFAKDEL